MTASYTKIKYKNFTAKVESKRPEVCSCCQKKVRPRGLHAHHTKYEFSTDEVREKPELAAKNVIYLCFSCHRVANAIRMLEEKSDIYLKLKSLIGD